MAEQAASSVSPRFRVLELFSGVGGNAMGLEVALETLGHQSPLVVASVDLSPLAIQAHDLNFPECASMMKSVESLSPAAVDKLRVNVWLMSPPCQPFTRQGNQKGLDDDRCAGLQYIVEVLLTQVKVLPELLFVENVKGFEQSDARLALVKRLQELQYRISEHLVNPVEAPLSTLNSRLRYYLVAIRRSSSSSTNGGSSPLADFDFTPRPVDATSADACMAGTGRPSTIGEALFGMDVSTAELCIEPALLCRSGRVLDIVDATSTRTNCFTKNYGRKLEGAGSVFSSAPLDTVAKTFGGHDAAQCAASGLPCPLLGLGLRFFHPMEVAVLMGFSPRRFALPTTLTVRQQWMLLGNSVNPNAVATVLRSAVDALGALS